MRNLAVAEWLPDLVVAPPLHDLAVLLFAVLLPMLRSRRKPAAAYRAHERSQVGYVCHCQYADLCGSEGSRIRSARNIMGKSMDPSRFRVRPTLGD